MSISEVTLKEIQCCLSYDEHFAIEPVTLKCGCSACKQCIKESKYGVVKCCICKIVYSKEESVGLEKNKLIEFTIKENTSNLFELLKVKIERIMNLTKADSLMDDVKGKIEEIETEIDIRAESLKDEIDRCVNGCREKLSQLKENYEKRIKLNNWAEQLNEMKIQTEHKQETLEDLNKNQKKLKKFEIDVEKFQQDLSKLEFKPGKINFTTENLGELREYYDICDKNVIGQREKLFISFEFGSKDLVFDVCDDLEKSYNFEVFIDKNQPVLNEITSKNSQEINNSQIFLAFITQKYFESETCQNEFRYANRMKKKIICILLEDLRNSSELANKMGSLLTKNDCFHVYSHKWTEQTSKLLADTIIKIKNEILNSTSTQIEQIEQIKLFISYSYQDKKLVREICDNLKTQYNIWLDVNELKVGSNMQSEIERGINSSDIVLVFISNRYCQSKNCRLEFFYANHIQKKVLHIETERLDITNLGGIGLYLASGLRLQAYKHESFEQTLESLIKAIDEITEPKSREPKFKNAKISPNHVHIISEQGGKVHTDSVSMTIPPKTLASEIQFQIKISEKFEKTFSEKIVSPIFELMPHFTTFDKPITLLFNNIEGQMENIFLFKNESSDNFNIWSIHKAKNCYKDSLEFELINFSIVFLGILNHGFDVGCSELQPDDFNARFREHQKIKPGLNYLVSCLVNECREERIIVNMGYGVFQGMKLQSGLYCSKCFTGLKIENIKTMIFFHSKGKIEFSLETKIYRTLGNNLVIIGHKNYQKTYTNLTIKVEKTTSSDQNQNASAAMDNSTYNDLENLFIYLNEQNKIKNEILTPFSDFNARGFLEADMTEQPKSLSDLPVQLLENHLENE